MCSQHCGNPIHGLVFATKFLVSVCAELSTSILTGAIPEAFHFSCAKRQKNGARNAWKPFVMQPFDQWILSNRAEIWLPYFVASSQQPLVPFILIHPLRFHFIYCHLAGAHSSKAHINSVRATIITALLMWNAYCPLIHTPLHILYRFGHIGSIVFGIGSDV